MRIGYSTLVGLLSVVIGFATSAASQGVDPFAEAEAAMKLRQYSEAEGAFRRIADSAPDTVTWARASCQRARALMKLHRFDDAIIVLGKVVEFESDASPREARYIQLQRQKSDVLWQVGDCMVAKADYAGALDAYLGSARVHPGLSWCGNDAEERAKRLAVAAGSCYERLGRYREAVSLYLTVGDPRAADLYAAAGQLDDLRQILARQGREYIELTLARRGNTLTREVLERALASTPLRRAVDLYSRAEAGDWDAIVTELRSPGSLFAERFTPATVLAHYPKAAVSIVKVELEGDHYTHRHYLYQILGLCGTSEAIAILEGRAAAEANCWQAFSIVCALGTAGSGGTGALERLDDLPPRQITPNLRIAIDLYKYDDLPEPFRPMPFPAIPTNLVLPREL